MGWFARVVIECNTTLDLFSSKIIARFDLLAMYKLKQTSTKVLHKNCNGTNCVSFSKPLVSSQINEIKMQ